MKFKFLGACGALYDFKLLRATQKSTPPPPSCLNGVEYRKPPEQSSLYSKIIFFCSKPLKTYQLVLPFSFTEKDQLVTIFRGLKSDNRRYV